MNKNTNKLILIRVDPEYITYLRKFDNKVQVNSKEEHKDNKPFVGVLFEINEIEYFVPISSNGKEKFTRIYENYLKTNVKPIDMFFIEDDSNNSKKLISILNINNMIPIPENAKIYFNIEQDKDFSLLIKEINYCNKHKEEIIKNSKKIYNAVTKHKWEALEKRCCDFKLLEEKSKLYKQKYNGKK